MSDAAVRVEVIRSGGFAGMTKTGTANTDELDEQSGRMLRDLLDASGLGVEDESAVVAPPGGADRFQYDITVVRGGRTFRHTRREPQLTAAEQALVRWVLGKR